MTNTEKIIKGAAMALAVIIIMGIISIVFSIVGTLLLFFDNDMESGAKSYEPKQEIRNLKVETVSVLKLEEGTEFKVDTNNKYVMVNDNNGTLEIKERKNISFLKRTDYYITIYIPKGVTLDKVDIENGAGVIKADSLNARYLELEVGAGLSEIKELNVSEEASITTGAGKLVVNDGTLNNLELEIGAGSAKIKSRVTGKSDITVGVGNLELELNEDINNYTFKVETGIGKVNINNQKVGNNELVGNGRYMIDIENGIGSVEIKGLNLTNEE